jgi:hypothetical protein
MANRVRFGIPIRDLGKADVEFYVWNGGARVGTLKVSKGAVVWFSRKKQRGRKIGWKQFSELMESHGRRRERR